MSTRFLTEDEITTLIAEAGGGVKHGFLFCGSVMFNNNIVYANDSNINSDYIEKVEMWKNSNQFNVRVFFKTSKVTNLAKYKFALQCTPNVFNWSVSQMVNRVFCVVNLQDNTTSYLTWNIWMINGENGDIQTLQCGVSIFLPNME